MKKNIKILLFNQDTQSDDIPIWWINLIEYAWDKEFGAMSNNETRKKLLNKLLSNHNASTFQRKTITGYVRYLSIQSEDDYIALKLTWS